MKRQFKKPVLFLFLLFSIQIWAQDKEISGTVVDEDQIPLPGVNVRVKNSNIGTVTDFDGNFNLEVPINSTLTISYVGFITKTIEVSGQSNFDVALETDVQ